MKIEQQIYLKEEGFRPEKCTAELESPVSSKFVSVRINGERHEYFNLRKTSLNEIVDILLLKRTSEQVLKELKENVKRLERKQDTDLPEFDEIQKAVLRKINNENVPNTPEERAKLFQDETPFFGNNDNFAQAITEAGIKAAKATHEFNMKEIKAKLIADLCVKLVEHPMPYGEIPIRAREIANKALEDL